MLTNTIIIISVLTLVLCFYFYARTRVALGIKKARLSRTTNVFVTNGKPCVSDHDEFNESAPK